MKIGDMIRVEGWPGTRGRRFEILDLTDETIHARDRDGKHRYFPRGHCHVDRNQTKARSER